MAQIQAAHQQDDFHFPSIGEIFFGLLAGIFFIAFSFPTGLMKLGKALGWSWVQQAGATSQTILNGLFGSSSIVRLSSFNNLWLCLGLGVMLYLAALASLSLKHQRFDLVGSGFLFLFVGIAFLHLLVWVAFISVIAFLFVLTVLGWIFQFLGFLITKLGAFLGFIAGVLGGFFRFIFGSAWWVFALLLVVLVLYLAVKHRKVLFNGILWVLGISGIVGVCYLLVKLYQFLLPYLRPIFASIQHIVGVIIHFLLILLFYLFVGFVVYGLGSLLLDQFRGAWKAGNGIFGVMLGSLAVGTSLALILLQTNLYNIYNLFPPIFRDFATMYLHQSSPPLFDTIIALLVLGVSLIGVLRNLPQLQKGPDLGEFQSTMVWSVIGVGVSVAVIAVAKNANN